MEECSKEKAQLQHEIDGFKQMIKDQNALITDLTQNKIEQKDWIKLLKKLENVDVDLQNMSGVLDQVLSGYFIDVDSLFAIRQSV